MQIVNPSALVAAREICGRPGAMAMFVALLRGINLGPRNRVPMAELRAALEEAGYEGPRTHLQTGNVILRTSGSAKKVGESVGEVVQKEFGLDIPVIVRTAAQIEKVASENPFSKADAATLHVAFLESKPTAAAARKLSDLTFDPEEFELRGSELYLRYPAGLGRSKMSPSLFEKGLETSATVRTWKVVTKLAELARS